jgi:hypothetical protein
MISVSPSQQYVKDAYDFFCEKFSAKHPEVQLVKNDTSLTIIEYDSVFDREDIHFFYDIDNFIKFSFKTRINSHYPVINNGVYEKVYDCIQDIFEIYQIPYTPDEILKYRHMAYRHPNDMYQMYT